MKAFTLLVLVLQLVRANFIIKTKNGRQTDLEETGEVSGTHSEGAFQNNLTKRRAINDDNDDYSDNQGDGQKVERKLPEGYEKVNSESKDTEEDIDVELLKEGVKITDKNWKKLEKVLNCEIQVIQTETTERFRVKKNKGKPKKTSTLAWIRNQFAPKNKNKNSNSNSGKLRFRLV